MYNNVAYIFEESPKINYKFIGYCDIITFTSNKIIGFTLDPTSIYFRVPLELGNYAYHNYKNWYRLKTGNAYT